MLARAVRGAFWVILSGTGARIFGIVGTVAVTHYLRPAEYGEVSLAALVMLVAGALVNIGMSQYVASRPHADRAAIFHATFYYLALGVVALGLALVFGGAFGRFINAPGIGRYLPLLAASAFVDRVVALQDRIQVRDMRFRILGVQRSLGELVYAATAVVLAATCAGTPFGGAFALAWAMMARSVIRLIVLSATTPWRDWAEPHRITMAQTREFFSFGLPMSIVGIAHLGASRFDNAVYSYHFGEAAVGKYNLTYNFADIPASLIAETVGDVLVPSFAHMESTERQRDAYLLAVRMLVFLVTPLSLGLAVVAPDLVNLAFSAEYADAVTSMLRVLALLAVPRTIIWTSISYLQVRHTPRVIILLECMRMVGVVVFMHLAIEVAKRALDLDATILVGCAAVVSTFALSALTYMVVVRGLDKVSLVAQILPLMPPAVASIPMILTVHLASQRLAGIALFRSAGPLVTFAERAAVFGPRLAALVLVGAAVFVPSALLLAPRSARQLLDMMRGALARRRGAA